MIVDLGAGDGLFVYHYARKNPNHFCIGIDSNRRPLEGISEKIHRKGSGGGAPNVIYLQAAAEALPQELQEIANEVYVLFPWGSLLKGVATGDIDLLTNIRRI
ncbi:MAG TPA: class I SAM-dependent methyltransferase, partial [Acidobacteriota bacterium]